MHNELRGLRSMRMYAAFKMALFCHLRARLEGSVVIILGVGYWRGYRLVISEGRPMDALAVIEADREPRPVAGLN
jgi:hypothetical protein